MKKKGGFITLIGGKIQVVTNRFRYDAVSGPTHQVSKFCVCFIKDQSFGGFEDIKRQGVNSTESYRVLIQNYIIKYLKKYFYDTKQFCIVL